MGRRFIVLTVFLALVVINCSVADSEVLGDPKTSENGKILDAQNTANSGNDQKAGIPEEKKGKDQVGDGSKKGIESNDNSGGNGEQGKVGVKKTDNEKKIANYAGDEKIINSDGDGKELGSKGANNERKKADDTVADDNKKRSDGNSKELGPKETRNDQKKMDNTEADNKTNSDGSSKQKGSKGDGNEKIDDTSGKDPKHKKTNDKGTEKDSETKGKAERDSGLESKDGTLVQGRKEGGEACDSSSNSCMIKEKSVVACLRVPGNETPDLFLLIQNKGKGPVTVTISAPDSVKLEQKQTQVEENNNVKVKVSMGNGGTKSNIVLKAGNGDCTLDFKELITQSTRKDPVISQLGYINLLSSTSSAWFILLIAVLVIASVCTGIIFRRKYVLRNSSKYQKLEMELPVSSVSKTAPDSNDGWDDNWDDNWDDEEVAMTTSMPVTPSFSSNGIAPRRINRDAWKD